MAERNTVEVLISRYEQLDNYYGSHSRPIDLDMSIMFTLSLYTAIAEMVYGRCEV